jgi:hypothetical protein
MRASIAALATCILVAAGAASAHAQTAVQCGQSAQTLPGDAGTRHTVTCPAGCATGSVWGTGTYSDDSSVCMAAIHAGALTSAGGTVSLEIAPGLSEYPPSTANGVTTSRWGAWGRSFRFVTEGAVVQLTCSQSAQTLTGDPGATHTVTCPNGCTSGSVWGTSPYSDDSSVCRAAQHAGIISASGGTFQVTIAAGLSSYPAGTANGVTTSSWGSWGRSFTVRAR